MKNGKSIGTRKNQIQRRRAEGLGRDAEQQARQWYETLGYVTLADRKRTARGEIDLIVADANFIVFVEVKTRMTFHAAAESVTRRQQARIIGAAEIVLGENPSWQREATRFDVILIVGNNLISIPDAFRCDDLS